MTQLAQMGAIEFGEKKTEENSNNIDDDDQDEYEYEYEKATT